MISQWFKKGISFCLCAAMLLAGVQLTRADEITGAEGESEIRLEEETMPQQPAVRRVDPFVEEIYKNYIYSRELLGQVWSFSIEILAPANGVSSSAGEAVDVESLTEEGILPEQTTETEMDFLSGADQTAFGGSIYKEDYRGDAFMQSASVVKAFIMAAVFDRVIDPSDPVLAVAYNESYDGELNALLQQMITVSDNEAANRLVEILGGGDFRTGEVVFYDFCMKNGYEHTSIGRRFLESNPAGDNYTCANDCRKLLSDIYYGRCVSPQSSARMLELLKGQTVRHKIPSGLPSGYSSGNKTGEMPNGYGLGCIENDIAIIFAPEGDYILCVLSNELGGDNDGAQQNIRNISAFVAEYLFAERRESVNIG